MINFYLFTIKEMIISISKKIILIIKWGFKKFIKISFNKQFRDSRITLILTTRELTVFEHLNNKSYSSIIYY